VIKVVNFDRWRRLGVWSILPVWGRLPGQECANDVQLAAVEGVLKARKHAHADATEFVQGPRPPVRIAPVLQRRATEKPAGWLLARAEESHLEPVKLGRADPVVKIARNPLIQWVRPFSRKHPPSTHGSIPQLPARY
jgi:hypothetical protein